MKALRARLFDMEMKKREEATQSAHDAKTDIGWGHQIRSYVLQPYQLVKDLRTGVESTNPTAVFGWGFERIHGSGAGPPGNRKRRFCAGRH